MDKHKKGRTLVRFPLRFYAPPCINIMPLYMLKFQSMQGFYDVFMVCLSQGIKSLTSQIKAIQSQERAREHKRSKGKRKFRLFLKIRFSEQYKIKSLYPLQLLSCSGCPSSSNTMYNHSQATITRLLSTRQGANVERKF